MPQLLVYFMKLEIKNNFYLYLPFVITWYLSLNICLSETI